MAFVTDTDLAGTLPGQGAEMVGFRQAGTGSAARTVEEKLIEQVSIFDYMSPSQIAAVQAGTSTDDSTPLNQALAIAKRVFMPAGTYRLEDVNIPSGRTLFGAGRGATIVKLKSGATVTRPLSLFGVNRVTLQGLTVDGEGTTYATPAAVVAVYGRESSFCLISDIRVTGVKGHSVRFQGCTDCTVEHVEIGTSGALDGVAAIDFNDDFGPSSRNSVRNILGISVTGRLVAFFNSTYCSAENIKSYSPIGGEVLYFRGSSFCSFNDVAVIGGGAGSPEVANPGSDGIALDAHSSYISGSNMRAVSCSGHGVSLCQTCVGCTLTNIHVELSDEGGVIITDQGDDGYYGHHNLVSNAFVINPAARATDVAFGVFGGTHNQFINCVARDDRATPRMAYGFREADGANNADSNHWRGTVAASECTVAATGLVGALSTATNLP